MNQMILDTSFLFALTNRKDRAHAKCVSLARTLNASLLLPVVVLPEAAYLLEVRFGHHVMRQFVSTVFNSSWQLESVVSEDLERAYEVLSRYQSLKLDFVDAVLIAIAERLNVKTILTLDQRHFRIVRPRHTAAFEVLPA